MQWIIVMMSVEWFGWLVLHFFSNVTALLSVIWLLAG
jgi:hypothetical protein